MTKPKTKKEVAEIGDSVSSIPQYNECIRRMKLGTLDKASQGKFRDLLVKNLEANKITEAEQDTLEAILRRERNGRNKKKMTISDSLGSKEAKLYFLINKIEAERLENNCVVKSNTPPTSFHCTYNQECRMVRDIEADRYLVYIAEELPPTHQYTASHAQKQALGQPIELEDLPASKLIWHFRDLNVSDFDRFFKAFEADEVFDTPKEEPIVF